ncbi:hypothetical protein [Rummeliibacillus stabekisii]|uniref:hypothetical protein n=1 Tax=Rummeliibacillus stabekisii TaxID=241244 RepID=UPI00371A3567
MEIKKIESYGSFGCCSHWKVCDLGKNFSKCVYKEISPGRMKDCQAYNRGIGLLNFNQKEGILDSSVEMVDEPKILEKTELEQLSLF